MRRDVWIVLVVLTGLVILGAAPMPHMDSDAPLYARIARDVLTKGDWVTFHHPNFFVDKPPVVFWIMAATFSALGLTDVTMRLWQLLLALVLLGLTYAIARTAGWSRDEGLLAVVILGSAAQYFYQATVPQQDVTLTLFLALAVLGLLYYVVRQRVAGALVSAAAVALAVLTKGIAGFALFGVVAAGTFLAVRRALPFPTRTVVRHATIGAAVCAALALPWFALGVVHQGDQFIHTFLTSGTLGIGRFFQPAISTPPPYWLSVFAYVPLLALGMLPWTPALAIAIADLPRLWRQGGNGGRIIGVWFLAIFVVLSVSSGDKVLRYLLPCLPPAALLTARAVLSLVTEARRRRAAGWIALIPAIALLGMVFWIAWTRFPPERVLLSEVFFPVIGALTLGLVAFGIAMLRGRVQTAIVLAAGFAIAGYAVFERAMVTHAAAIDPWPAIARAAAPHVEASDRIVLYGRLKDTVNFAYLYFDEPVATVEDAAELAGLWRRERLLVILPAERIGDLAGLHPAPVTIHRSPARLLMVTNGDVPAH